MLAIPRMNINPKDYKSITDNLETCNENQISYVNWKEEYPFKPDVSFKIAHNGEYLFLQYFVKEKEIMAHVVVDNGPVYTDSCVEFFISFPDSFFYYNLELSCIGKALFGYRKDRKSPMYAEVDTMQSIKRYPSLGTEPFVLKKGNFKWNILVVIPASAYWQSGLTTFNGLKAKGNFYKCGDNLPDPHYLSWNPIYTPEPDFHRPEYFHEIVFG